MKVIDFSYIQSATDGDADLTKELVDVFKLQIPEFIQDFELAIQNQDVEKIGKVAHKAKSSVQIFGMQTLAEQLNSIEEEIDKQNPPFDERYPKLLDFFKEQTTQALNELEDLGY